MTERKKHTVRSRFFWAVDSLKGAPLYKHYQEIVQILSDYGQDEIERINEVQLNHLLKHASSSTAFYAQFDPSDFHAFPVLNKNIIKQRFNDFLTNNPAYPPYRTVVTSGSTGTPFSIIQDLRKYQRNTADTIYFGELANYRLGQRLYYLKIWNNINQKSRLLQFSQNIKPVDVLNLDHNHISIILDQLQSDKSNKGILAYASVYEAMVSFIQNSSKKYDFSNIHSAIAMSERYEPEIQQAVNELFKVGSVSRYSNMENGILAQHLPYEHDHYVLNQASYFFEILDFDTDEPVKKGQSGRIVITDLYNYSMPLIRYDTGDVGSINEISDSGKRRIVMDHVEGRKMDIIYDTGGSMLSSFVITNNMWKYGEIDQYQFIQKKANEYSFVLNTKEPFLRESELLDEFRGYLGANAKLSIEYASHIPVLASGKRKKVINENQ
jgi:phenylacetate-CoA ligase